HVAESSVTDIFQELFNMERSQFTTLDAMIHKALCLKHQLDKVDAPLQNKLWVAFFLTLKDEANPILTELCKDRFQRGYLTLLQLLGELNEEGKEELNEASEGSESDSSSKTSPPPYSATKSIVKRQAGGIDKCWKFN